MTTPDSPRGYTPYEQYSFQWWVLPSAIVALLAMASVIIFSEGIVLFSDSHKELLVGAGVAILASLYAHESLHYLASSVLGYDPVFLWPNAVYVPEETLNLREISTMLLAPQLLSIIYVYLLLIGLGPSLELVIGWGLVLNLGGAASDVAWIFRRVTWPEGTKVVVGDDQENYVAFPKDSL